MAAAHASAGSVQVSGWDHRCAISIQELDNRYNHVRQVICAQITCWRTPPVSVRLEETVDSLAAEALGGLMLR